MKTPGVEVRPIRMMDGRHYLNAVFFNNVRIPRRQPDRRGRQRLDLCQVPAGTRAGREREPALHHAGALQAQARVRTSARQWATAVGGREFHVRGVGGRGAVQGAGSGPAAHPVGHAGRRSGGARQVVLHQDPRHRDRAAHHRAARRGERAGGDPLSTGAALRRRSRSGAGGPEHALGPVPAIFSAAP